MPEFWDDDPEYYGGKGARWSYDTWWYRHGDAIIGIILVILVGVGLWIGFSVLLQ